MEKTTNPTPKSDSRPFVRRRIRKRSKMISFRVSLEELDNLTVEADRRELSLSELVREALQKLFGGETIR